MITRFIHTVAMLAALLAVACGLWQDWGLWVTLKRLVISYLAFYCLVAVLALVIRSVPFWEGKRGYEKNDAAGPGN